MDAEGFARSTAGQVVLAQGNVFEVVMRVALLLVFLIGLVACSDGSDRTAQDVLPQGSDPNPFEGYTSEQYDAPDNWLCRPDLADDANVCSRDISATLVFPDGTTQPEAFTASDDPAVDCFYVYPTISADSTDNSDLVADSEISVTYSQAARYRSVCRMFAPVYRQITISALFAGKFGDPELQATAYGDVLDAFKHYIANADGRGFILIGHSQGTTHLINLIREEIEVDPYLADRMIAAHLIGIPVALPVDAETGATFEATPPCTFDDETNCFVNYSSFRATAPPQEGEALFGVTDSPDTRAACSHPVDLGGGRLELDAVFSASQLPPYTDPERNEAISTPFVKLPGLFEGECIEQDGKGYLAITINGNPDDPRVDDVADFLPGWGLHMFDVGLAQGDLVRLAERQASVWLEE